MSESEVAQLIITMDANISRLTKKFDQTLKEQRKLAAETARIQKKIERDAAAHAARLEKIAAKAGERSGDAFSRGIKGAAAGIAAAFSVRELAAVVDTYTKIGNQLRVVGLEGGQLLAVQQSLFEVAQKNGVAWEQLSTLYGRTAQSQKSLRASSQDIMTATESVAFAIRAQGGDVEQVRGALLQLGQAYASPIVHAEEFNSINENMLPLLNEVSKHIKGVDGDLGKLKLAIVGGKISNQEFFRAVVLSKDALEDMAEKALPTIAQSFEKLKNALTKYIGEADKAGSISRRTADGIAFLAENLDTLMPLVVTVSTLVGVGMVTNFAKAQIASKGLGGALLGAFGGPVGIAIGLITLAIGAVAAEALAAEANVKNLEAATDELVKSTKRINEQLHPAKDGVAGVGDAAATATPLVAAFAGEIGKAADELYRLSRNRWIEEINKQRSALINQDKELQSMRARSPEGRTAFRPLNTPKDVVDLITKSGAGGVNAWFDGGERDRKIAQDIADAEAAQAEGRKTLAELIRAGAESQADAARRDQEAQRKADLEAGKAARDKAAKKAETAREKAAREAEAAHQKRVAQDERFNAGMAKANDEILKAKQQEQVTIESEVAAEVKRLDEAETARGTQIDLKDEANKLRPEQAKLLDAAQHNAYLAKRAEVIRQGDIEIAKRQAAVNEQALELQIDVLQSQAALAQSTSDRADIDKAILKAQQDLERLKLQQVKIENGATQAEVDAAQKRLAALPKIQGNQNADLAMSSKTSLQTLATPLTAGQMREQQSATVAGALNSLADAAAAAAVGAGDFDTALRDTVQQLTQQILRDMLQQLVVQPLAAAAVTLVGGQVTMASATAAATGALAAFTLALENAAAVNTVKSFIPVPGFASGGQIRGPGTGTSDSIPIWASRDEFMVRAKQAKKHRGLLEAINSGRMGRYAQGGMVRAQQSLNKAQQSMAGPGKAQGSGVVFDMRGSMIWENEVANIMAYVDRGDTRATVVGGHLGASTARAQAQRSNVNRMGR